MKQNVAITVIMYLALPGMVCAMDSAYQWTDSQGQTHYGDKPPASSDSRMIALQGNTPRAAGQSGLRPGEYAQLKIIQQRQRQQQHRAQTAGTHSDRQRAARRSRCAENRVMLKKSRGNENFKKHARYLRNNCW